MVSDQLLGLGLAEVVKGVVGAFEVSFEGVASFNDLLSDLITLFFSDTRAKRVVGKVTSNSDSCGDNHGSVFLSEGRSVDIQGVHVGLVSSSLGMTVVVFNDLVEEGSEHSVRIMTSSIDTNARVRVLAPGEDGSSEIKAILILLILQLFPKLGVQVLAQK